LLWIFITAWDIPRGREKRGSKPRVPNPMRALLLFAASITFDLLWIFITAWDIPRGREKRGSKPRVPNPTRALVMYRSIHHPRLATVRRIVYL
jgi:hypothetical protein